jgi:hypothetical protein
MRRVMRRMGFAAVIALAVLMTVQPVLHRHSLMQEGAATPCAACAFGTAYVIAAPVLAAPVVIAYQHATYAEMTTSAAPLRAVSSRAPPLA